MPKTPTPISRPLHPGYYRRDVSRCRSIHARQARRSRSSRAGAHHRRACARARATDRNRPARRRGHDRAHAGDGPLPHHAAAGLWWIRIRLRRVLAGGRDHRQRLRVDRLGLWPACLAPVAHRLLSTRGPGRGVAGPRRARHRQLCPGRTGGGSGRRLPALGRRQLLQRLRQRAVAVPGRHDPATGWRGEARIFSPAQRRLHHRRQLAHDGACRHRQQNHRRPRRVRPRPSRGPLCRRSPTPPRPAC